ncbi:MAG: sulfite reductase [Alphaproteobacteria bacterium]|nr:sulfite reductase [Alphaproteobacteria bacterium]
MGDLLYPSGQPEIDPDFPDAPADWSRGRAEGAAQALGLALTAEICEVIRVLQGCYKDEVAPRLRLLHDALQARFAAQGGMKYLYGVLPGGPIVQGCHLAGLRPPAGARDQSFGSVA